MRSKRIVIFCLLGTLTGAIQSVSAQQTARTEARSSDPVPLETIVTRMEEAQQRNRDNYRAYTVTREYKLYGAQEDHPKSEVLADVSFVPPDRKTFKIEKTEGNDRGVNIVKHVLEHESQAAAAQTPPGAIDRNNYDFKLLGEEVIDGQPCWTLQLLPKREERVLLRGKAWVDKDTYLIHQLDGELAKSPSWWLKKVQTEIHFGSAAGMWLQTRTKAQADVRMFGTHTFTAQAIRLQTSDTVATRFSPTPPKGDIAMAARATSRGSEVRTASAVRRRPTRPVTFIGAVVP